MKVVRHMIKNFEQMLGSCYSVYTVENMASDIRESVASGKTTWNELGFTDDEVSERLRSAKVRDAKKMFQDLLNPSYSVHTLETLDRDIRKYVADGTTTWDELDFTDAQLAERLRDAKVREAEQDRF